MIEISEIGKVDLRRASMFPRKKVRECFTGAARRNEGT